MSRSKTREIIFLAIFTILIINFVQEFSKGHSNVAAGKPIQINRKKENVESFVNKHRKNIELRKDNDEVFVRAY